MRKALIIKTQYVGDRHRKLGMMEEWKNGKNQSNTTSRGQQTLKIRQPIKASSRMRRSRAGSSLRPGFASHAAHDENIRNYDTFGLDSGY